jgi:Protein of unknown function (DUF1573)
MKSLLRLALSLIGSAALPLLVSAQIPAADTNSSAGTGPIIKFDTEAHDFNKALANDSVSYTFTVTNAGDATLDIIGVKPGCSCTVVNGSWKEHIAPHETGLIPVTVHTSSTGPLDKTITVTSNDKTRPSVLLHMKGIVWLPIEVAPPRAYFTVLPSNPNVPPQTLKIFNRTDEPLVLQPPQSTSPAFSAVLTTNVPGKEFELKVTLNQTTPNPDHRTPTYLQTAITMVTSLTNMPVLTVNASADIQPEVRFMPPQIQLATGPLPRGLTNNISVQNNTSKPFKVLDASINVPGVNVAVKTLTPEQNYTVVLGFPQGFLAPSGQMVKVTINTDNTNYPTIEVPVMQILPRRTVPALPATAPATLSAATPAALPTPTLPALPAKN